MTRSRYSKYGFAEGWPSVTAITGQLEKPYLYGWYAKLGAEAHRINAASKKIGTLIDNEICHYFGDEDTPELDKSVLEHPENKAYYIQAIRNFHIAADYLKLKSVMGQKVVYSKLHQYIGTFDRLLVIDNKLILSDWKATNTLSYEYKMQLEGYYRALIEMIQSSIIVLGDEYKNIEWHEYPLWLIQFPKKEEINLDRNIIKFKSSDLTWDNFKDLLHFYNGKREDEKSFNIKKEKVKNDKQ